MAPAQDYKRIFDGDEGPNTGGMGCYSPVPGIGADHAEVLARAVHQPIVDELRARGTPFHGVLYAGLMMTADGPKVLEYNAASATPRRRRCCRGCAPTCSSCSTGRRARRARGRPARVVGRRWAVTVVLASRGYPESSSQAAT